MNLEKKARIISASKKALEQTWPIAVGITLGSPILVGVNSLLYHKSYINSLETYGLFYLVGTAVSSACIFTHCFLKEYKSH